MGGVLALRHLCPLAAPMFLLLGVHAGGPRIQKRICLGGACHKGTYAMGFVRRPCTPHSSMGGKLALRHHRPREAPPLSAWGGFYLRLSFSSSSWGVFNSLLLFSLSSWWVFLFLLSRWDYEGHGRFVASATCFVGLCFYGHSFVCHS